MTNQEAFDKAAVHLIRQGKRAESIGGACMYRGPNGTRCAIGALIPDAEYRDEMEGIGADLISVRALDGTDVAFRRKLQKVHDNYDSREWRERLRVFAGYHSLSTAILDAEPLGPAEKP